MTDTKVCRFCGREFDIHEFRRKGKTGNVCTACTRGRSAARSRNLERVSRGVRRRVNA